MSSSAADGTARACARAPWSKIRPCGCSAASSAQSWNRWCASRGGATACASASTRSASAATPGSRAGRMPCGSISGCGSSARRIASVASRPSASRSRVRAAERSAGPVQAASAARRNARTARGRAVLSASNATIPDRGVSKGPSVAIAPEATADGIEDSPVGLVPGGGRSLPTTFSKRECLPDMRRLLYAVPFVLIAAPASAQSGMSVSLGADYAQGKYGTPITSKQWTFPFVAKYEAEKWSARVTVPFTWIENPSVSRDGTPLPCAGSATAPRTASGLGDIMIAGSVNVIEDRESRVLVDLTGKVKLGTGDETECLGTGENDFYFQGDFSKSFGSFSAFGTLGWRKMGDPPGTNFKDPLYFSVGGSYRFSRVNSLGFAYDYRQKLLDTSDPLSEATLYLTHRLSETLRIQYYFVKGFSHSSPDWAIGAFATRAF